MLGDAKKKARKEQLKQQIVAVRKAKEKMLFGFPPVSVPQVVEELDAKMSDAPSQGIGLFILIFFCQLLLCFFFLFGLVKDSVNQFQVVKQLDSILAEDEQGDTLDLNDILFGSGVGNLDSSLFDHQQFLFSFCLLDTSGERLAKLFFFFDSCFGFIVRSCSKTK